MREHKEGDLGEGKWRERSAAILERVKRLENLGYSFEGAEAASDYEVLVAAAKTTAIVMFLVAAALVSAWLLTVADLLATGLETLLPERETGADAPQAPDPEQLVKFRKQQGLLLKAGAMSVVLPEIRRVANRASRCSRVSGPRPRRATSPPPISKTYCAAFCDLRAVRLKGSVLAIMPTSLPSLAKNKISRLMGVFFIQNDRGASSPNMNSMPVRAAKGGLNIKP